MGNFKKFIINEEMGLGELGTNLNHLMNSQWFGDQVGGAYATTDVTGSEQDTSRGLPGHSNHLPSTDITIPSVVKTGRIIIMHKKKNPIYIRLSDGTEAKFTYDEFKRIQGDPEIGKVMTITFQRFPEDTGDGYSKIDKAIVRS